MRPRRFYIFFPPALVKTVRGGIEYGIGSIPLGGYVKIPGMHKPVPRDVTTHLERALEEAPWLQADAVRLEQELEEGELDEARVATSSLRASVARADLTPAARRAAERGITDIEDGLSSDAYWRAPAWKRIAVIFAGPATNLVFAVVALAVFAMLGAPEVSRAVDRVDAGSPAARAGLRPGDVIVAVDGKPVKSFASIHDQIAASKGRSVTLTVSRGGQRVSVGPLSARYDRGLRRYIIGYRPQVAERKYAVGPAVGYALDKTGELTVLTAKAVARIFTGSGRKDVSSVVGITQASSQAVQAGFKDYLAILGYISLSLALLNLLPLLPLDGGHIAFSVVERIRRRPVPREAYERASALGIALVVFLFFIGLSNDIGRIRGG
jgi:regulator of sigma E protease